MTSRRASSSLPRSRRYPPERPQMAQSTHAAAKVAALVDEGRLAEAVAAATSAVKANPASPGDRFLLAELLILEDSLERADLQLKLATDHAPPDALAIAQTRRLLRAAEARRAWHRDSAVPEFIDGPTERQRD